MLPLLALGPAPSGTGRGPLVLHLPPDVADPVQHSLPFHEPLAMTSDLKTLRSCPLPFICESLICHQECWELPSLVMGTQPACLLPSALFPSRLLWARPWAFPT